MRRPITIKALSSLGAIVFACSMSGPASAANSSQTAYVQGKALKYLGTGLREFLWVDIYKLSAYSKSGSCSASDIIGRDEPKALRLRSMRDIPIDKLKSNLKETFEENLPTGDTSSLKQRIDAFLGSFKSDLKEGVTVEIIYEPGKGTTVSQGGKAFGPATPGKDFAELIWRSYFGPKTCCSSVKSAILEKCGK